MLVAIDAPHFYAGIVLDDAGIVVQAAPIVRYMIGWTRERASAYISRKRWSAIIVSET